MLFSVQNLKLVLFKHFLLTYNLNLTTFVIVLLFYKTNINKTIV